MTRKKDDGCDNTLTVKPVENNKPTKYLTIEEASQAPDLLRKLPSTWGKNKDIAAATKRLLNVAPIFTHDSGTGSVGCMVIDPPVFLTEQEAIAIIRSEAETKGLSFSGRRPGYIVKKYKYIDKTESGDEEYMFQYSLKPENNRLKLYYDKRNIAVTFISMSQALEREICFESSSIRGFRPRKLAELTAADFSKKKGNTTIGVFFNPSGDIGSKKLVRLKNELQKYVDPYEPLDGLIVYIGSDEMPEKLWESIIEIEKEIQEERKAIVEENLRAQVRGFLEWLRGQEIIGPDFERS